MNIKVFFSSQALTLSKQLEKLNLHSSLPAYVVTDDLEPKKEMQCRIWIMDQASFNYDVPINELKPLQA